MELGTLCINFIMCWVNTAIKMFPYIFQPYQTLHFNFHGEQMGKMIQVYV